MFISIYRRQIRSLEDNVFIGICLFTNGRGVTSNTSWGSSHGRVPLSSWERSGGPRDPPGSNIWWWPLKLKHGQFPSGQYASYWNAFLFISVFKLINFSCQYQLYWVSRCGQLWIHTVKLIMSFAVNGVWKHNSGSK